MQCDIYKSCIIWRILIWNEFISQMINGRIIPVKITVCIAFVVKYAKRYAVCFILWIKIAFLESLKESNIKLGYFFIKKHFQGGNSFFCSIVTTASASKASALFSGFRFIKKSDSPHCVAVNLWNLIICVGNSPTYGFRAYIKSQIIFLFHKPLLIFKNMLTNLFWNVIIKSSQDLMRLHYAFK